MAVALLAFTGFPIFDVLSSLKLEDLVSHQYQYQYRLFHRQLWHLRQNV